MIKKLSSWYVAGIYTIITLLIGISLDYFSTNQIMKIPAITVWAIAIYPLMLIWIYYDRQHEKGKFEIRNWKWIFYIVGFLGFINILFWIMAISGYWQRKNKKEGFMNSIRVLLFMWGIIMTAIIVIVPGIILYEALLPNANINQTEEISSLTDEQEKSMEEYNAKINELNRQIENIQTQTKWLTTATDLKYYDVYDKHIQAYNELYDQLDNTANEFLEYINKNENNLKKIQVDIESERQNLKEMIAFYKEVYEILNNPEEQSEISSTSKP